MTPFRSKNQSARSRRAGLAAAIALTASLAGCGPAATGLQPDTASHFRELVLGVSQAAAANDHTAAHKTLDSLEADVASAAGSGQVSEERRQRIMAGITAVRADLNAAAESAAAATKAAEEAAAEKTKAAAEAAAQATQENIAPVVPAPVPAPARHRKREKEPRGKAGTRTADGGRAPAPCRLAPCGSLQGRRAGLRSCDASSCRSGRQLSLLLAGRIRGI
ncbi:hypothetical protein AHiyo4_10770 [Arthrobacter sp. Hiyo4]|nr:hypothetical protein AHiyo4_10770 [Arthrobacter sp. Hiyo4]